MRAIPSQKSRPSLRRNPCERHSKNGRHRLKKYAVKRADPRKAEQLDNQENDEQAGAASWHTAQTEPGDPESQQRNKNILPFLTDDSRGAGIVRYQPSGSSLKTEKQSRCMQDADDSGNGTSDYQRREQ